ncbi:hypothetical protein BGZ63DRAFT_364579 [Mariannaea sp. PMI_226]|nr:hypothetical protein BGZ63DRAFT_364579 [Mariannaea sp. PMI_226]
MSSGSKRSQRTAPFLQENWLNGVNNAAKRSAMGGGLSTPKRQQQFNDMRHVETDERGAPPSKRRRMSSPDSLVMEDLIASPGGSQTRPTLRIEVFKVLHKDSKKVRAFQSAIQARDVLTTKGRCRITVYDMTTSCHRVLHCESQACDIFTYKNPVGPHRIARIELPRAFYVPEESILVNRIDENVVDFPDVCKLVVQLESASKGQWPPLETHDFGIPAGDQGPLADTPKRQWIMTSEFTEIFGRCRKPVHLSSSQRPDETLRLTDYIMDVDLSWSSGFRAYRRIEKGSLPCITAIDPEAEIYATQRFEPHLEPNFDDELNGATNGINGHYHEDNSSHEAEDDMMMEGDQTPSRSLRVRESNKIYNLKVLSDQAQGRERKRRARAGQATTSEGRVTYFLPTDQPVALDSYRCIACGWGHKTMALLQLHLQSCHSDYECILEMTSQGPQFRVSSRPEPVSVSPSKTFRLARPLKPFCLQLWAPGDHSYENRLTDIDQEDVRSPDKSSTSRQLFGPSAAQLVEQENRPPPKKRKVLIPETGQPVFDPVSKVRLKPGDEVPIAPKDNDWLIHKHRENIAEFSDVTPAEKEYVCKWDAYILQQHLTSSAYFPRAWVSFIRDHAAWLASSKQRMLEFAKHSSYLLARDLLDDAMINTAFGCINAERSKFKSNANGEQRPNGVNCEQTPDATPSQSPRAAQIRKNKNGCAICQLPVLGPRMLLCSSKTCSHRLYHSDCVGDIASTPVNQPGWLCNACSESKEAS